MYDINDFPTMTINELIAYRDQCIDNYVSLICEDEGDTESHLAILGARSALNEISMYIAELRRKLITVS